MTTTRSPRPSTTAGHAAVSALAIALLAGCGQAVSADEASVTEDGAAASAAALENCGRELVLDSAPSAAVGMHPAQTELLLRLGLADRLAGQAQAGAQALPGDVADLAEDVPVIGDVMPPAREDLLAVEPDFVYSPTTYEFTAEQGFASIEQIEQAGAAVYVATGGCAERRMSGSVADLFTDLENLGEIFGVQDTAAQLVEQGQAELDEVASAIADVEQLRVAQVYVEGTTLSAIGAGVEYDILQRAGADSVYAPDQSAFDDFFAAPITPESLAAEQPDALVFSVYDDMHEAATRDYLTSTFPDMPAVREGRLIAVSSADVFPGTLGNISIVRQISEQLYPDAF
ncbi:ABC transporter substrate-binding protein [Actinotalea sp. BY-33]|uniref:ABC transporter substrate-binding protein n=1 Tax=Actinotalea soli TaxID=2819234 RepID=A0A939LMP1_9CELL|nr:ABC transporter substrate-binding protein [Actinotalea soli]MBO1750226.1 ABC transporter substrate-binding protein [Actinotalea soli]